jgi:hypothetical protein
MKAYVEMTAKRMIVLKVDGRKKKFGCMGVA